jgi:hypothetical protein
MMGEMRYCTKCRRTMDEKNFYQLKSGEKSELCKSCETMHINNFDPDTFMWLLEKYDVPYIESEWNILRDRAYQKDPYKMNGMSVIGKYMSKMKLKQWKMFTFADSEMLNAQVEEKRKAYGEPKEVTEKRIEEMKAAYANGEISEAQLKTYVEIQAPQEPEFTMQNGVITTADPHSLYPSNNADIVRVDLPDPAAELTEEDKIYLATKWGRLYSAADWVALEKSWNEYEKSFDLHNADLINGTKQLCKLELKGNQALDTGDIDSYSKIARASDALRKSLKFTEAQRKEERQEDFNCYGQIVAFAEKENDEDFIRPIDLSVDRDIVDKDIRNIKQYTKTLIEDDPAVFKLIEQYIKKRDTLAQQEKQKAEEELTGEQYELTDTDLKDYTDAIEEQKQLDRELQEGGAK